MVYSVKELAQVSGVTVRTLHFYDELGLLKPAYYDGNGYRVYGEKQLLVLQQILFFRELGFELKEIQRLLGASKFDHGAALRSHRKALVSTIERTRKLIKTIDNTLAQLKGKKMKAAELFKGFDSRKQAEYERQLIEHCGESAREGITESRKRVEKWTKGDWEKTGQEWDAICRGLVKMMGRGCKPNSMEAQELVRRHFDWLKHFWMPNRESYAGHGQFIEQSELRQAYDKYHPELAGFLAEGIKIFAERELA
jgi:DNA-binding transcriptional MerR regulator